MLIEMFDIEKNSRLCEDKKSKYVVMTLVTYSNRTNDIYERSKLQILYKVFFKRPIKSS